MTSLEKAQLKDAEAAVLVIKPTGFSLLQAAQLMAGFDQARLQDIQKALRLADGEPFSITDAVKFAMAQKLRTTDLSNISYEDALAACLKDKKNHISTAHYQRLSQRGRSFGEFIGPMMVREIPGAAKARPWVESRAMPDGNLTSKCTWNKLVTDLGTIFGFFVKQKWCSTNPFSDIPRFSKKSIGSKQRLRRTDGVSRRESSKMVLLFCAHAAARFAAGHEDGRDPETRRLHQARRRCSVLLKRNSAPLRGDHERARTA